LKSIGFSIAYKKVSYITDGLPFPPNAMLHHSIWYPITGRPRLQKPGNNVCFLVPSVSVRYRTEVGVVPKGPLLSGTYRIIRPERQAVFGNRERLDIVAEVADRVYAKRGILAL
jgi:hypothetical protein